MLLVVMLFGIATALLVYGMVDTSSLVLRRDQDTAAALAQAKQALIGRAASDANRPGSLPCPDTDDDGSADLYAGTECPPYSGGPIPTIYIGRLPWRTLGLPDLRDAYGERLWYAVLREFARNPTCAPSCPINSDTKGNITVYQDSAASAITTQAVAVIFASGAALETQNRDPAATALCPTTGTTIARSLCAANYLDATGGADNAQAGGAGPFITAQSSATFNDRLLVITTAELMPPVEQRVARELRTILQNYKAKTACACTNLGLTAGCYPWADLSNGYSDADPYNVGDGRNRGRIPVWGAAPHNWGAWLDPAVYPSCPPSTYVPTLPSWFDNNNWRLVVYYSAGRDFLGPGACTTCVDPTLTVGGVAGKEVVILMPGPLLAAPPRAPVPLDNSTYWQYYFEDGENQDFANDVYVTPTSTAYTRDRIFTIP